MGLTADSLKKESISINALSQISGLDRRTITKYLDAEEVDELPQKGFKFVDAFRALVRCSKGQSSADRRNDAQAQKLELEVAIMEGKWIPVEDVAVIVRAFLGAVNRELQESKLEDKHKERIVDKLRSCELEIEDLTDR